MGAPGRIHWKGWTRHEVDQIAYNIRDGFEQQGISTLVVTNGRHSRRFKLNQGFSDADFILDTFAQHHDFGPFVPRRSTGPWPLNVWRSRQPMWWAEI